MAKRKHELDWMLRDELRLHGCKMEPEDFRVICMDILSEMFPGSSVDQLQADWRQHRDYCQTVRHRSGMRETGDTLIGRTLQNIRKKGFPGVSLRDRAKLRRGGLKPNLKAKAKAKPDLKPKGSPSP